MIAQINTGRGFGGLVNYANDIAHKNTVIIASAEAPLLMLLLLPVSRHRLGCVHH